MQAGDLTLRGRVREVEVTDSHLLLNWAQMKAPRRSSDTAAQETAIRVAVIDALLWTMVGVVAIGTVALSLAPTTTEPPFPGVDKVFHFSVYATLTFLLLLAGVWRPGRGYGRWPWGAGWVVAGAALLGGSIELAQSLVSRDPNIFDACANLAGALVALGLWRAIRIRAG